MGLAVNSQAVNRIYSGTDEVEHIHLGDAPALYDRTMVPVITGFAVSPTSYIAPNRPSVNVSWTSVTGEENLVLQMVVPYFADDPDGVISNITIPIPGGAVDGSVELTSAAANTPFSDHYGYVRAGIDDANNAKIGNIADEATSKVTLIGGHRNVRASTDNFHISWTGMPTSGSVYGRWVPNTGNAVDFTMTISNVGAVYNQWSPLTFAGSFYEAHTSNFSPAGTWNASTGQPRGKFYLYSDDARTQQINLRTTPIGYPTSVQGLTLPTNSAWTAIRNYSFVLTARNDRGKAVARANVQRIRTPVINYFRVRAGSFARSAFNNNLKWMYLEWSVTGWPHPDLTLAYAPSNTWPHALSLTAADPDRRTTYNAVDTGTGDDRVTVTTGDGGAAIYRLTATNSGGTVHSDASYNWPI